MGVLVGKLEKLFLSSFILRDECRESKNRKGGTERTFIFLPLFSVHNDKCDIRMKAGSELLIVSLNGDRDRKSWHALCCLS